MGPLTTKNTASRDERHTGERPLGSILERAEEKAH
jgi:hypothetical protein